MDMKVITILFKTIGTLNIYNSVQCTVERSPTSRVIYVLTFLLSNKICALNKYVVEINWPLKSMGPRTVSLPPGSGSVWD